MQLLYTVPGNMRKTDKKIDNQIRVALTEVCETALKEFSGFEWLTHLINYDSLPKSFKVVCIFDSNENLINFKAGNNSQVLSTLVQQKLSGINMKINDMGSHIYYDTEENCEQKDNGKWADRLNRLA